MSNNSQANAARPSDHQESHALPTSSDSLAEISRKWLADIAPENFTACHEYLAAVRLARHMTKIDVCRASQINGIPGSGVSLPTVSKIESGNYGEPGFRTMLRLARGYGIPMTSLERFFI